MSKVTSIKSRARRRPIGDPSLRALVSDPSFKALLTTFVSRSQLANRAGITYNGHRNLFDALGYQRILFPMDYFSRYLRNAVAARIVEAKPQATWRGGGVVIEDEDPNTETDFEKAWAAFDERLKVWTIFERTDILAGLGRYAVLYIGSPGEMDKPIQTLKTPDDVWYLTPYSEVDATIQVFITDPKNVRFGLPEYYGMNRMTSASTMVPVPELIGQAPTTIYGGRRVHYSRVIHVADGLLDDHIFGLARLERCWNLLDDLDKVTGGGAEAFWRRADAGLQVDVDPEMELDADDEADLDQEIDDYIHRLRRVIRTRGVKMNPLTSQVAGIKDPIDGIMSQISAGTGIPQRILMGSERGQLASTQDDDNWTARIVDRRRDYAQPIVARPFIDKMIAIRALPKPKQYKVGWPEIDNLDEKQKATIADQWAGVNQKMGTVVVTPNEIRDRLLGLPPLANEAFQGSKNKALFLSKYFCLSNTKRSIYFPERPTTRKKKARS